MFDVSLRFQHDNYQILSFNFVIDFFCQVFRLAKFSFGPVVDFSNPKMIWIVFGGCLFEMFLPLFNVIVVQFVLVDRSYLRANEVQLAHIINCTQTKLLAIILVLWVFYAIFRLIHFSSDPFEFSSLRAG